MFYNNLKVTACRFAHGGKRHAQLCAYRFLHERWACVVDKPLLLFLDSDIQLDAKAINYFVHDMSLVWLEMEMAMVMVMVGDIGMVLEMAMGMGMMINMKMWLGIEIGWKWGGDGDTDWDEDEDGDGDGDGF